MSRFTQSKELNEKHAKILAELLKLPENKECADCTSKGPRWASTNLGLFMCINCSGIHRKLGVHISKVKSTTLDTWTPEQIAFIKTMGNKKAAEIWEARLPHGVKKPSENDPISTIENWIFAKYVRKEFVDPNASIPTAPATPQTSDAKQQSRYEEADEEVEVRAPTSRPTSTPTYTPKLSLRNSHSPQPQQQKELSQPPQTQPQSDSSISLLDLGGQNNNRAPNDRNQDLLLTMPSTQNQQQQQANAFMQQQQQQQPQQVQPKNEDVNNSILSMFNNSAANKSPATPGSGYQQGYYGYNMQPNMMQGNMMMQPNMMQGNMMMMQPNMMQANMMMQNRGMMMMMPNGGYMQQGTFMQVPYQMQGQYNNNFAQQGNTQYKQN